MLNLLRAGLSLDELADILRQCPRTPLLPARDDAAWTKARAKPAVRQWIEEIRPVAMAEAGAPLPALTPELYAVFQQNGNRLRFESVYFDRRHRLARAAIMALLDPSAGQVMIPSLIAKAREIFTEPSWCLPAHTANVSGMDPMKIDLFAAETANLVGDMLTLFPEILPDDLTSAVRSRVQTQVFENYLVSNDLGWYSATHNWNAVCHQGVVGAALSLIEDPGFLARILHRAAAGLPKFLEGFSADGGSSEGPGYWGYGFGWFAELNRQLEARTGGRLSLFGDDPHVAAIAQFGPALTLSGNHLVNFSDSGHKGPLGAALLAYLGERLNDPVLRAHGVISYHHAAGKLALDQQRCDVLYLTRLVLQCPADLPAAPPELPPADFYLPNLGVVVARSRNAGGHLWEFAAKAGHNDEHHNHNDVGSFILNIDGERACIEIGSPEYVKAFFSRSRYSFLAARSLGHSVPRINGHEQDSVPLIVEGSGGPELASAYAAAPAQATTGVVVCPVA